MKHVAQWPLRKPLALFAALLVGGVVAWSLVALLLVILIPLGVI